MGRSKKKKKAKKSSRSWLSEKSGQSRRRRKPRRPNALPRIPAPGGLRGSPADELTTMLVQAGYDLADKRSIELGMSAFMTAQMVAMAAGDGAGPSAEIAGGAPLGGIVPEMIPRLGLRGASADTERLMALFEEDPELRLVRFDTAEAVAWLSAVAHERPSGPSDVNVWLDGEAARFSAEGAPRRVAKTLHKRLLEAAPRWSDSPADLRCLALGITFASVLEKDAGPNPITSLLFRLTLKERFEEADAEDRLLDTLGADIEKMKTAFASGEDALPDGLVEAFSDMPKDDQDKIRRLAERRIDELGQQIISDDFPVPLPTPCVIQPLVSMLELMKQIEALDGGDELDEALTDQLKALVSDSLDEGLHPEAQRLYVEVCDHWLESESANHPEHEPLMRSLRHLGATGSLVTVERALILASLRRFRFSEVPGEPAAETGVLGLDATYLERYGDFLLQKGYPALALRTWRASEALQPLSEALAAKIAALLADPPA